MANSVPLRFFYEISKRGREHIEELKQSAGNLLVLVID